MAARAHDGLEGEGSLVEEELYLGDGELFVTHYRGLGRDYVVIVPPWFEELPRTRKVLVNMARDLARQGLDVVRFDYHGTGLSAGDAVTLEGARADLERVMNLCAERGATRIHRLGFRMGGYLALTDPALGELARDGRIVLWEPIADPRAYLDELLRREVSNQMITFGRVKFPQEELLRRLRARESVLTDGYPMSPTLHAQLELAPPLRLSELRLLGERLELLFWENKKLCAAAKDEGLASQWCSSVRFSWRHIRSLEPRSTELFEATATALRGRHG